MIVSFGCQTQSKSSLQRKSFHNIARRRPSFAKDMIFKQLLLLGFTDMFAKLPLWKETFPRPKPKRLACPDLMGSALAMRSCLALDPQSRPSAQEFMRQINFWAPSQLRLLVLDGRREFHGKRGRFSILLGELSPDVLHHLQQDAEAIRQGALYASEPHVDSFQEQDDQGLVKAELFGKLGPVAPAARHIEWPKGCPGPSPKIFSVCGCFQEAQRKAVQQF